MEEKEGLYISSRFVCKSAQAFEEGFNSGFSIRKAEILTGLGFSEAGHSPCFKISS